MSEEVKEEVVEPVAPKDKIQIRDLTEEGAEKSKELRFTRAFHMDWEDDDGVKHSGLFRIKRPTIIDEARIGVVMAELRDDKPASALDRSTFNIHEMIAVCKVWVITCPAWFDVETMYNMDPIARVYREALAFKASFRAKRVE